MIPARASRSRTRTLPHSLRPPNSFPLGVKGELITWSPTRPTRGCRHRREKDSPPPPPDFCSGYESIFLREAWCRHRSPLTLLDAGFVRIVSSRRVRKMPFLTLTGPFCAPHVRTLRRRLRLFFPLYTFSEIDERYPGQFSPADHSPFWHEIFSS